MDLDIDLYILIYGLIFACPLGWQDCNCPFYEIRMLPPVRRVEIVNSLSKEELLSLRTQHKQCFQKNEMRE